MNRCLSQLHPRFWRMTSLLSFLFWWFGLLNYAVNVNCCPNDAAYNWTVSVYDQEELDDFMKQSDATSVSTTGEPTDDNKTSRCIRLSIMGDFRYRLDIVKLMQIKLGTSGGLVVVGMNGSVEIDCVASASDIKELKRLLKPISNASLVMFDGLTFANCPVPILIEEVSLIAVQNCNFM